MIESTAGPPRLLLVSGRSVAGGAERILAGLATHLGVRGWDVHAVLFEPGPLQTWLDEAAATHEIIDDVRFRDLPGAVRTVDTLRRIIRRRRADVVLANGSRTQVYTGPASALARRPCVWFQPVIPGPPPGEGPRTSDPRVEWLAARTPAAEVVTLGAVATEAQRRLTPRRRITLVHPGVDLAAVRSHTGHGRGVRSELGWDEAVSVVGMVARWHPWKGQDVFVRAAIRIAEASPEARFVLLGGVRDEAYAARVRADISRAGLSERTAVLDERMDAPAVIDAFDVLVHPAFGEPFGLVLVEAMALGVPVVAVDAAGPSEIVRTGQDGTLVPPGDDAAMASATLELLRDPAARVAAAACARERAERFGLEAMTDGFEAVLRRVASR